MANPITKAQFDRAIEVVRKFMNENKVLKGIEFLNMTSDLDYIITVWRRENNSTEFQAEADYIDKFARWNYFHYEHHYL